MTATSINKGTNAGVAEIEMMTEKEAHNSDDSFKENGDAYDEVLTKYANANADSDHGHGLQMRTGHGWGRGIKEDIKRTIGTHWKREMVNLNSKTVAVSFFLYFACIAPAVTFGAMYGKATNNYIGAVEMIAATAWCGIVYSLVGGQPMMINGGTGPVLAFTEILYKMSKTMDVPFLTLNAWIGIWVFFYMVVGAVVDFNRIIILCTRFTDEIFSFLISLIFIINAIGSPFSKTGVIHYFDMNHKSHDPYEDQSYYSHWASALLSLVVFLGTTYFAFLLRRIKFSPFLPNQTARNVATDFAVLISILVWSLIGNAFEEIPIEKLNVPDAFAPTFQCCDSTCSTSWPNECYDQEAPFGNRSWFVNLLDVNGKAWIIPVAALPALLAFVLIFLDDGITWHLINHPSHKLKHGEAYNYDTIVIGVMVLVNSLLGLPWLVAATVRSLNHIHAMAEKSPNGDIISVQETRLTHLGIHLLCFVTIFALPVLKLIPVPVLYGVFLFMGLVSLGTNQFWGRILMFLMQPSKYPVQPYTQYMKVKRMHLFTAIQLLLFVLLYVVKSIKAIAIAFPILIAACIPVRLFVLPKIFTEDELILIDSDPQSVKMWIESREAEEEGDENKPLLDDEKGPEDDGDVEKGQIEADSGQNAKPASPRVRRKKTVSCPTGSLMFTEEPSVLGPQLKPQMLVGGAASGGVFFMGASPALTSVYEDISSHTNDTLEGIDLATPSQQADKARRRNRPSREERRSNSCPVADAMFFGSPKEFRFEVSNSSRGFTTKDIKPNSNLATLHEPNHSQHSSNMGA